MKIHFKQIQTVMQRKRKGQSRIMRKQSIKDEINRYSNENRPGDHMHVLPKEIEQKKFQLYASQEKSSRGL